jgi:predicted kinase
MNTLAFAKPLVLVLVGLPGAGKTFFARQFAEMFSAPLVSHNRLQYELFATPQYTPQEQDIITRLADNLITELLKTKRSFIVDGGSASRQERLALEQRAKKAGYDMLIIWVQTDPGTAKLRAQRRNPSRVDDQFTAQMTSDQFALLAERYVPPAQEKHVVISGKHAFSTQAKMVLRKLSVPHVQQAAVAHASERPAERKLQPAERPEQTTTRRVIIS